MRSDNDPPSIAGPIEQAADAGDASAADGAPKVGPIIPFNLDGVPVELREHPNWVSWRVKPPEKPDAKFGKVPINPRTGRNASATDPKTWGSLGASLVCTTTRDLGGVGFMFSNSPYTGIDLDHCRDPRTGVIEGWACEIIKNFDTYTEVSPSGTGAHVIVRAKLPGKGCKVGNIEVYDSARFFTITGALIDGTAAMIAERQAETEELYARLGAQKRDQRQRKSENGSPSGSEQKFDGQSPNDLSDEDLIERARTAKNGSKFEALWRGDHTGYESQSNADLALCAMLAFWTGPDPARIDRLFRLSGLMRDKWDELRGAQTYGAMTIEVAISGKAGFYRSSGAGCGTSGEQQPGRPLTDTGNAERLVDVFDGNLRYSYAWNKWMGWAEGHWGIDQAGSAMLQTKSVVSGLLAEATRASDAERALLAKFALASQRVDRRKAMVELAKCEPTVPVRPAWFDRDPYLLNCPNGTLDLRTFELREPWREDFITKMCPTRYVPGAPCSIWLRFLERVLPDDEVRDYAHRLAGYCLTGDVSEQMMALLIGDGANGKSTWARAIQEVLSPAYAIQIASELLVAKGQRNHPTEVADLFGVRAAFGVETEQDHHLDEAFVKQLTGGDRLRARRMREDFWEFDPTHKIFLLSNHMPLVRGVDHAIWRRLHLIRFEVTIPFKERNRKLSAALRAESEGILAWMVDGCRRWRERGLDAPSAVLLSPPTVSHVPDPAEEFVCTRVVSSLGSRLGATNAYQAYCMWCEALKRTPVSQQLFGSIMGRFGYGRKKSDGRFVYLDAALVRDDQGGEGPHSALISPVPLAKETNAEAGPCGPCSSLSAPAGRPDPCYACGCTRYWRLVPAGQWTCARCHAPIVGAENVEWNEPDDDTGKATRDA